jgi:glycosyltransferase involved in cell wall biosynthesis
MQFQIPIVATNWNGIPFVVNDNKEALLVESRNVVDLAKKIELLISNNQLRSKLGFNGRKLFLEKYTIDAFVKNMDNVFKII